MSAPDLVKVWLDGVGYAHSGSQGTADLYRRGLRDFCVHVDRSPREIVDEYRRLGDTEARRAYARHVHGFISVLRGRGYTASTVANYVIAVKSFFKYTDLPLAFVPQARRTVVYHNREITKDELVAVLNVSRPRDRAFFCMMAQSGLRPATLCQLRIQHIQPDFSKGVVPCKVEVPQQLAKGKYGRHFTFVGEETVEYLKRYFHTRRNVKDGDYVFTGHGSNKPLNTKSISNIFLRSVDGLRQTGVLDMEQREKRKPRPLRLYVLRKWFRKAATHAGFDYVNFWMGHTLGVDEHYFSRDPELHRTVYAEMAMPGLRLETATPTETEATITELRQQLEASELKNAKRLAELERENQQLKVRLNGFGIDPAQMHELLKRIERLEKSQKT